MVKILTDNGHTVNWWMRSKTAIEHLKVKHHNPHYLTMVNYDMKLINLYEDISLIIRQSDIILIGVPSAFLIETMALLPKEIFRDKIILSSIKGILPNENVILNEYLENVFDVSLENYCCIAVHDTHFCCQRWLITHRGRHTS